MRAKQYAIAVETPGYSDCSILCVVSGRRALFSALRDEINADFDFYWNKRMGTLSDLAKYGGAYYGHETDLGNVNECLTVWILTDEEAQRIEDEIESGLW